jgi:hypothetical protein
VNRGAWALSITALRGARVGFVGLALIGLACASLGWIIVREALLTGTGPGVEVAMGAPLFSAGFCLLPSALFVSMWQQARRPGLARLAPGAERALRHAMYWSGLALWLGFGLPALAVALVGSSGVANRLPLGVALFYGLGVPAAGAAAAAAFIVLPARVWVRTTAAWSVTTVMLLAPSGIPQVAALPVAQRNAVLLVAGLAGLLFSAWAFLRVAQRLTQLHADQPGLLATPRWQFGVADSGATARTPRDGRWLALPFLTEWRPRDLLMILVVVLVMLLLVRRLDGIAPSLAANVMLVFAAASGPWVSGAWVSPRWSLLPGGLVRQHAAWRVLRQGLHDVPRAAAFALAFSLAVLLATNIPLVQWSANLVAAAGVAFLSLCIAVATRSWGLSSRATMAWPTMTAMLVCIAYMAVPDLTYPSFEAGAAPLSSAVLTLIACVALGLLSVAASSRAWARYDWSRMPAQPGLHDWLVRTQRRPA